MNGRKSLAVAAIAAAALWILPVDSASAGASAPGPAVEGGARQTGLYFAGFNVERAALYGYDVRTDDEGWQYAVPTGTPPGSLEGATPRFNPGSGEMEASPGGTTDNKVNGDCGSAELTLYDNTTGYTAYHLNGLLGPAISHSWGVSLESSIDMGNVPLNGLPPVPGLSLDWGTDFSHSIQAVQKTMLRGIAGGTVETILGSCFAGNPFDEIVYS